MRKQEANGMWRYDGEDDIESTAAAIRGLLVLGASPHDKVITVGIGALMGRITEGTASGGEKYQGWPAGPGRSTDCLLDVLLTHGVTGLLHGDAWSPQSLYPEASRQGPS